MCYKNKILFLQTAQLEVKCFLSNDILIKSEPFKRNCDEKVLESFLLIVIHETKYLEKTY